jgi:L-ascorbate metabolism protein UlaG (beta-lactamase superfamily)
MSFETGPYARSDHYNGKRFFNPNTADNDRRFGEFMKWVVTRDAPKWQARDGVVPAATPPAPAAGEVRATFVNHSTVLIQMDGVNVLTDPIWSERASPVSFAGSKRFHAPGLRFEDLPPIHAVVISHNHYDHMDLPTLTRLQAAHRPRFLAGLGNKAYLEQHDLTLVTELDWWQSAPLTNTVKIHFVPARHFSSRVGVGFHQTLWGGFVLDGPSDRVYFAGDTGYAAHFAQIRERLGPLRLALLPIGAYLPRWFMAPMHISPAEAVRAQEELRAEQALAIHFGTFHLADDAQDQPGRDLQQALRDAHRPAESFWVPQPGQSFLLTNAKRD